MAFIRGLFLALLCVTAQADSRVSQGGEAQVGAAVTFAVPDVWPWGFKDSQGVMQGSLVELIARVSELSGVPVQAQLLPLRRVIRDVLIGRADFAFLFQSPDLDDNAFPVDTVLQLNLMLMALESTDHSLTLESLAGKRVGYVRGAYLGEAFEANEAVMKVPVYNISQAVEMLLLGRISAVLASDHNLAMTIDSHHFPIEAFRFQNHIHGQNARLYMSLASDKHDQARRFREALQQMREDGELQRLFQTSSVQ